MSEAAPVKILLLGDATVGKSQLLVRFAEERFDPNCIVSIGVDTRHKIIACRGRSVKVQVWDAAGKEEFRTLISNAYYEKAHGALIVYDITNQGSFKNVAYWKQQIDAKNFENIPIFAIGNKTDLVDVHMASLRIHPDDENNLSHELGIPFRSVSAKTGDGVKDAFEAVVEQAVQHIDGDEPFGEPLPPASRCACTCAWLQRRQSATLAAPTPVLPCPNSAVGPVGVFATSPQEKYVARKPVEEVALCQSEAVDRSASSPENVLKDSRSKLPGFDEDPEALPWNHTEDCTPNSGSHRDGVVATRSQHDSAAVANPCNIFSALIRAFCECEVR